MCYLIKFQIECSFTLSRQKAIYGEQVLLNVYLQKPISFIVYESL